jgi:hypothetical protein
MLFEYVIQRLFIKSAQFVSVGSCEIEKAVDYLSNLLTIYDGIYDWRGFEGII